jgi:epoxyqueuosine reductase
MPAERVSFSDQVRRAARELAFDAVAIARAGPEASLDQDTARWEAFIGAGMHGEMGWLGAHRGARLRLDGEEILAGARSVVCLARRYQRPPDAQEDAALEDTAADPAPLAGGEPDGATLRGIARYARGRDYHRFLRRRLRRLASFIRTLDPDPDSGAPRTRARVLCDEEPVLERAWAARAGLGFVGKNGMLIVPGAGSMVLLGEVVTTLELEAGTPIRERCGSCTRCLEACPTDAFAAPFVLDARRCVSYLTIEQKSAVDPALRPGIGAHLFGCDDCQTVCPFNAGIGARSPLSVEDGDPFAPLERWSRVRLADLLALDDPGWRVMSEGTPLKRAGRAAMARNAAIVLGNRGDAVAVPALREAATRHDDAMVREAAEWALERIAARGRRPTP